MAGFQKFLSDSNTKLGTISEQSNRNDIKLDSIRFNHRLENEDNGVARKKKRQQKTNHDTGETKQGAYWACSIDIL